VCMQSILPGRPCSSSAECCHLWPNLTGKDQVWGSGWTPASTTAQWEQAPPPSGTHHHISHTCPWLLVAGPCWLGAVCALGAPVLWAVAAAGSAMERESDCAGCKKAGIGQRVAQ